MTVLRLPVGTAVKPCAGPEQWAPDGQGVRMLAYRRDEAVVVTISGQLGVGDGARVHDFVTHFLMDNSALMDDSALVLDLSRVDFFGALGVSVLIAVDAGCRSAAVPWALVPSGIVSRVLQLTGCDGTLPIIGSVHGALNHLAVTGRVACVTPTESSNRTTRRNLDLSAESEAIPGLLHDIFATATGRAPTI